MQLPGLLTRVRSRSVPTVTEYACQVNEWPLVSVPCVTESDIDATGRIFGLRFDESRRNILRSNGSFDVQACPGSGKTSLLVAKLAILASKWPHARRGICVISHTNAARQEIESKLADTVVDRRLLNYPHFVGTIHGFVNEFLALPILRSEGYHAQIIDDDACFDWIRRLLLSPRYQYRLGNLPFKDRTLSAGIRALTGAGSVGVAASNSGINAQHWALMVDAKEEALRRGLWYYADMFAWAEKLQEKFPHVCELVRWRFPAIFLDEAQDTSELQARLLQKVFPASACELRQRFGDSNQAIYDTGQSEASTDKFPAEGFRLVTDSQRFGSSIARLAHPVAPNPPAPELCGNGPRTLSGACEPASIRHTVFLFAQSSANQVLPAFGRLLLDTFPDRVLRGDEFVARAIGRVGESEKEVDKIPRNLSDYWYGYEALSAKLEPRPSQLLGYVRVAWHRRMSSGECNESVKLVMKGVIELIRLVMPNAIPRNVLAARWLWEALKSNTESTQSFRRLLWDWCVDGRPVVEESWPEKVESLKASLNPVFGDNWSPEAQDFCNWSAEEAKPLPRAGTGISSSQNVFRFEADGRHVDIHMGTIHSAKGQTHVATLLVETFYKKHDLADLLPWLSGQKTGAASNIKKEQQERMRLVYTAMTRPSHVLCLALRGNAVRQTDRTAELRERLESRGWRIVDLDSAQEKFDAHEANSRTL